MLVTLQSHLPVDLRVFAHIWPGAGQQRLARLDQVLQRSARTQKFWDPDTPGQPGEERLPHLRADKQLEQKLVAEYPGILAWMVRGCRDWLRDGLRVPERVTFATSEYRKEQDSLGDFFGERCKLGGSDYKVRGADLSAAYTEWAKSSRQEKSKAEFFAEVRRQPGVESYTNNGICFRGIALRPSSEFLFED